REVAVRTAMGASRLRLVEQMLVENALFALAGGVLGLLLASLGTGWLISLNPENLPRIADAGANVWVVLFALALTLATALLFGVAPALQASRADLNLGLKEGGSKGSVGRGQRLRAVLVVAQVCLALVLLVGSGLMLRSFEGLRRVDPGFDP